MRVLAINAGSATLKFGVFESARTLPLFDCIGCVNSSVPTPLRWAVAMLWPSLAEPGKTRPRCVGASLMGWNSLTWN